jgi:ATP-dependent exoDNAse (exonuclease V) alpha subunit
LPNTAESHIGFGDLDELLLAHATTIYKSQGSEYPTVVIPLSTRHYPMLQRNLIYTGVTQGKRLVVLVSGPWRSPTRTAFAASPRVSRAPAMASAVLS